MNQSSNKREDEFGRNPKNRIRFVLEILKGCSEAIGSHKVGLRISPYSYADVNEDSADLSKLYKDLTEELNSMRLAYLHLSHIGEATPEKFELWKELRHLFGGTLILCGDFTQKSA